MIVVDAGVAAKWVLLEADSDIAASLLLMPASLAAPELIILEVFGAITRKHRMGIMNTSMTDQAFDFWKHRLAESTVELVPNALLLDDAYGIAKTIKHSLQDCLYLALAIRNDATLITSDMTFIERAQSHFPHIKSLRDYALH